MADKNEWAGRLSALLRIPVQSDEDGSRSEFRDQIERLHDILTEQTFDREHEWFDRDESWVVDQLERWLTDGQAVELFDRLDRAEDVRILEYLNEVVVARQAPAAESSVQPAAEQPVGASEVTGTENAANWNVNRVPGTYFYAHDGSQYVYSDQVRAPATEWLPLAARAARAAAAAQAWGAAWCTPTGGDVRYGGDYVFAVDREGPWLTQGEVEAALLPASQEAASPEASATGFTPAQLAERDTAIRSLATRGIVRRPDLVTIPEQRRLALAAGVIDERWQRTGRWTA